MKYIIFVIITLMCSVGYSHEMTPTYLTTKPSVADSVHETVITIFNRRDDVEYYELSVFDSNWKRVPFAALERVFQVKYLHKKNVTIYFREKDLSIITYVCTTSKLLKDKRTTVVASRICSKVKQ